MLRRRAFLMIVVIALSLSSAASAQEIRVAAAADLEIRDSGCRRSIRKADRNKSRRDLRFKRKLFLPTPKWRAFRSVLLGRHRLSKKTGSGWHRRAWEFSTNMQSDASRSGCPPMPEWMSPASDGSRCWTPSVQKIAIANPEHAPYGRAAVAALQNAGIYEQVKPKLVYGENISQAAQFVQSGNAQAGIVAMSLAVSPGMKDGKRWEIPADMHPPIEQAAILLKNATNKDAARAFLDFVKSESGRATLAKYGFTFSSATAAARLLARRTNNYGRSPALSPPRALRFRHSSGGRTADRLLAGVFELARQVFARSGRRSAAGAAAHGSWFLRARRHGAAWPAGKILASIFRPRLGLHVRRAGHRFSALQLAICRPAPHRFLRVRRSQTPRRLRRARRRQPQNILASDSVRSRFRVSSRRWCSALPTPWASSASCSWSAAILLASRAPSRSTSTITCNRLSTLMRIAWHSCYSRSLSRFCRWCMPSIGK